MAKFGGCKYEMLMLPLVVHFTGGKTDSIRILVKSFLNVTVESNGKRCK